MNFWKTSEGGGGGISIPKFILQIFAIIKGNSVRNFGKNPQNDFPKMRGGGLKAFRNFSENSFVLVWLFVPYNSPLLRLNYLQLAYVNLFTHTKTGVFTHVFFSYIVY